MNLPLPTRATRLAELTAWKAETPPDAVGKLMRAGALVRRAQLTGVDGAALAAELRELPAAEIAQALDPASLRGVRSALLQAAEEAVEAALAEDPEERRIWQGSAWEAMRGRDLLESLERGAELLTEHAQAVALWKLQLAELDRALLPKWRWFVALNEARRVERELLDPAEQQQAPWFSSRAECDGLIRALAGERMEAKHLDGCSDCQRDLLRASAVEAPASRHLDSELLWRYDLGELSASERAAVDRHAKRCEPCGHALRALAEGEDALHHLERQAAADAASSAEAGADPEASAPRSADAARPGPSARRGERRGPSRSVISERREFRVVLVREAHVRVVVQPLPGFRIAACAVQLGGGAPRTPRETPDGYEFDLGLAAPLDGAEGTVMVKLGETTEPLRCRFEL